jgi:hypothetical protein
MTPENPNTTSQLDAAVSELQQLIASHYSDRGVVFELARGDEENPDAVYLTTRRRLHFNPYKFILA